MSDHLVPLELGGAPRDPGNLWPEPHYGTKTAYTKNGSETKLKNAVCNGSAGFDPEDLEAPRNHVLVFHGVGGIGKDDPVPHAGGGAR
ncbi:hypothetical protein OG604_48450 [Streptomyces sp. NBC_01231]|nr:hypothetical protein OG604_48450 [Streptomyces sp. NBC_01231]